LADSRLRLTLGRRRLLTSALPLLFGSTSALAFGQEGAFHPRVLTTGGVSWGGPRATAPGRWAWELVRRTSAPARLVPGQIAADDPRLMADPFAIWVGETDVAPLTGPELSGLRAFLDLGGVLVVDDSDPAKGAFGRAARRELLRVLPESPIVKLVARAGGEVEKEHVIFKSYYLIDRPVGRVEGPPFVEAVMRGRDAQVLFLQHDLLGALARASEGTWRFDMSSGGTEQREYAVRFAVNLAMYVLCSNYKDDQVHAQALMRRRGRFQP
jgi:hypothetical protein